ncbi:MAG TPA: hypothetical protein DGA22_03400 [Acidobacterium sp.]|nr:hypothetical protein [Acidobacterium sp.]
MYGLKPVPFSAEELQGPLHFVWPGWQGGGGFLEMRRGGSGAIRLESERAKSEIRTWEPAWGQGLGAGLEIRARD